MEEPNFIQVVGEAWKKDVWSLSPDCIFRDRLKNVKASLRVWSRERFNGHKEKIITLKNDDMRWELEEEKRTLNDNEREAWLEARKWWEEKERIKKISMEDANSLEQMFTGKEVWDDIQGSRGDNVTTVT
ncbi:hypothetical protein Tco_1202339 [Tanacetum coccineum]